VDIGEQQRVIIVEPLQWPEESPPEPPEEVPVTAPEPVETPA
jgi:hypothetical protein